jgi:hypothetical protein
MREADEPFRDGGSVVPVTMSHSGLEVLRVTTGTRTVTGDPRFEAITPCQVPSWSEHHR